MKSYLAFPAGQPSYLKSHAYPWGEAPFFLALKENSATQKRVNALNEIYRKGRLLEDGASITFDGDSVKVAFYSMPTVRTDEVEEEGEEEFVG